jgi:hypothetical protein
MATGSIKLRANKDAALEKDLANAAGEILNGRPAPEYPSGLKAFKLEGAFGPNRERCVIGIRTKRGLFGGNWVGYKCLP